MQVITSPENKLIKRAASLKDKKFRDLYGEFCVEGKSNVKDSMKFALPKVVFISEEAEPEFSDIDGVKVVSVSKEIMRKITDTVNPQNIAAVFGKLQPRPITSDHVLYLDGISDPGNLGTIIRCCAATGYELIFSGGVDPYNPKVVRSAMSGIFCVNIEKGGEHSLVELKNAGYKLIGADARGEDLFSYRGGSSRICLVIGNEAHGISAPIADLCDIMLSLPMRNMESLNAAVSAAVMMYNLKFNGGY